MPIHTLDRPEGGGVPHLGAPYRIVKWTISVTVECACPAHHDVMVVLSTLGQLLGTCPGCGAEFALGGIRLEPGGQKPEIAIAYTPPVLVGES